MGSGLLGDINMSEKEVVLFTDEQGKWLVPESVVERIKKGEDFDLNARNENRVGPTGEDSVYVRLNSKDCQRFVGQDQA